MNRAQRRRMAKQSNNPQRTTDIFRSAMQSAFAENKAAVEAYLATDLTNLLLLVPRGYGTESEFPQPAIGKWTVASITMTGAQAIADKLGATEKIPEPDPGHYGVVVVLPDRRYFAIQYFAAPVTPAA